MFARSSPNSPVIRSAPRSLSTRCIVAPISAGDSQIVAPASMSAAFLALRSAGVAGDDRAGVAHAAAGWRRAPAMKATTGFVMCLM